MLDFPIAFIIRDVVDQLMGKSMAKCAWHLYEQHTYTESEAHRLLLQHEVKLFVSSCIFEYRTDRK